MSRVPAWADTRNQKLVRRLKEFTVIAFFALMTVLANQYVHRAAMQAGRIQGPTLLDLVLFRRIVVSKDSGKQKITLFGKYEYEYLSKRWH